MYFLTTLTVIVIVSILLSYAKLNKTAKYFYVGALIINGISTYLSFNVPEGDASPILQIFIKIMRQGHVGISFLVVVMMLGALKKSKPVVNLFKIRGELSILGVIFLFNHFVYYIVKIITSLPKWHAMTKTALIFTSMVSLLSIWAWIICIPLFITSFRSIRRKMNAARWKAIQRYAYIMYALVYLHIMFAFMSKPDIYEYSFDIMVYSGVFLTYLCLRLRRYMEKLEKRGDDSKNKRITGILNLVSLFFVIVFLAMGYLLHQGGRNRIRTLEEEKREQALESEKRIRSLEKENQAKKDREEELAEDEITEDEITEEKEEGNLEENTFKDGKYTGQAEGYNGMITVEVTIKDDDIQKVELVSSNDDKAYMERARTLLKFIEESDSTQVDTVSGATISSKGLIKATENALEKAVNNE